MLRRAVRLVQPLRGRRWFAADTAVAKAPNVLKQTLLNTGSPAQQAWGWAESGQGELHAGSLVVATTSNGGPVMLAMVKNVSANGKQVQLDMPTRGQELIVKRQNILLSMQPSAGSPWESSSIMELLKKASSLATSVSEKELEALTTAMGEREGAMSIDDAARQLFGESHPHHVYALCIILASPGAKRYFQPMNNDGMIRANPGGESKAVGHDAISQFVARIAVRLAKHGIILPDDAATRPAGAELNIGNDEEFSLTGDDGAFIRELENVAMGSADVHMLPEQVQKLLLSVYNASHQHGIAVGRIDEAAAIMLKAMGMWKDGENLHLRRTPLVLDHLPHVVAAAEHVLKAMPRDPLEGIREDMEGVAFAIDESLTAMDIDDAIGYELVGDEEWVHVHVADVGAWLAPGSELDLNAAERCSTVYLPERVYPMFPEGLSRNALSLMEGRLCMAMTFSACLHPDGSVKDSRVWASRVSKVRQVTYSQVERALASHTDRMDTADDTSHVASSPKRVLEEKEIAVLRSLQGIAAKRREHRKTKGSLTVSMPRPDVSIVASPSGEVDVKVSRAEEGGIARSLVEECMLLAGQVAAGYAQARRIPFLFRAQVAGARLPAVDPSTLTEAASVARHLQQLMGMPAAFNLPIPAPHRGLGLPGYAQVTSPIRRYSDLLLHHQIRASLAGLPFPFKSSVLSQIAARLDQRNGAIQRLQKASERFWVLEFLRRNVGPWPAMLLPVYKKNVRMGTHTVAMLIPDLGLIQHIPPPPVTPPLGAQIMATVTKANPHRGELIFKIKIE